MWRMHRFNSIWRVALVAGVCSVLLGGCPEEDTGTDGTPGSEQNTFVKTPAADFDVVINVRQGKSILAFDLNQTISDNTVNVTVVRQPDTIAT